MCNRLLQFALFLMLSSLVGSSVVLAAGNHRVKGYINKHGVYVESHRKTNPNKTQRDNWSTKGHINPSNGKSVKKELRK